MSSLYTLWGPEQPGISRSEAWRLCTLGGDSIDVVFTQKLSQEVPQKELLLIENVSGSARKEGSLENVSAPLWKNSWFLSTKSQLNDHPGSVAVTLVAVVDTVDK